MPAAMPNCPKCSTLYERYKLKAAYINITNRWGKREWIKIGNYCPKCKELYDAADFPSKS